MVAYTRNLSTWEVGPGRKRVQSHPLQVLVYKTKKDMGGRRGEGKNRGLKTYIFSSSNKDGEMAQHLRAVHCTVHH